MSSIGILYICTGPYVVFWNDFFNTFEERFLPGIEKRYYVFTDQDSKIRKESNVFVHHIENQPWPLITLLRFHTFLNVEDEINKNDYLMFSNSNIVCKEAVGEEEFLPKEGENLFFVEHPGYYKEKAKYAPFDRNKKSLAYVPYNCGNSYVIGAMFGGKTPAFLEMSKCLRYRINEDLKKGVIARWHDESHINRYIISRNDYRLLSPSYCYPVGFDLPLTAKICGVSKQDKFDVNSFKGFYAKRHSIISNDTKKKIVRIEDDLLTLIDSIEMKKIERID